MHHSTELPDKLKKAAIRGAYGATGKFPGGKLDETDEGELRFGVGHDAATGKVVINFGKSVSWLATDAEQAFALAESIRKHARDCRVIKKNNETELNLRCNSE